MKFSQRVASAALFICAATTRQLLKRRKRHLLLDAFPFDDCVNEICGNIVQHIHSSARPLDFYFLHHGVHPQPKMQSWIVGRDVTSPSTHFIELSKGARPDGHARPNGRLIAFHTDELKQYAMILTFSRV